MKNEVKNRVIVESDGGDRAFLLLEGDIFRERADVYIFNSYKNDIGMLLHTLRDHYQEELPESPFYFSPDGTVVNRINLKDGRVILVLHSEMIEHTALTAEQYNNFIKIVFTSLTALESYGEKFETIAFPVLLRNSLNNIYSEAVEILIEASTYWLKMSDHTKLIKYVLFENGDAELWNEKLNLVLGRSVMDIHEFSELRQYRDRALSILKQIDNKYIFWEDTLLPIQDSLQRNDFRPEVVAAFSRKLLEVYCYEMGKADGKHNGSLEECLSYMRNNRLLNQWDIQTLYQIRSFGNPSIHRPDPVIGPKGMNEKDVTILLIDLCKLLELLYEFVSANHAFTFK
ncbi:hypothetical protein [Priestia megaterium]|uniref:hypothetical protein n=2 Tax=Priestia megaterium TaxID=1404 RepID=UPI00300A9725